VSGGRYTSIPGIPAGYNGMEEYAFERARKSWEGENSINRGGAMTSEERRGRRMVLTSVKEQLETVGAKLQGIWGKTAWKGLKLRSGGENYSEGGKPNHLINKKKVRNILKNLLVTEKKKLQEPRKRSS